MLHKNDFVHPEDAIALNQLESIPGFKQVVKKFMEIGAEQMQYGVNMASSIRLSPTQLPDIYNHLPRICEQIGIEEPEFYLTMNPVPNAWTYGDTRKFITVTSGLVESLSDDELDAVIAHECGHILLRHTLYTSIASIIAELGLPDMLRMPAALAFKYWMRKSELSADRVSAFVTSPEATARVMVRLGGGPVSLTNKVNLEEWAAQADKYEEIRNDGAWNKSLQVYAIAMLDHPFPSVRVREILNWGESEQFQLLKKAQNMRKCPHCGEPVEDNWKFCKNCGNNIA
jgi:Zn-dependent protease with chaperone function